MKMRNRIVTVMLAVALVCALLPTVALADTATPSGQRYADVPADAWYAEAVNAMTEGGLLTGYDDGLFHPDDTINVGQFATILCRIGGISTDNNEFKPHEFYNIRYETPYNWAHMAIMNLQTHTAKYPTYPNHADRLVIRGEAITAMEKIAYSMPKYRQDNDLDKPLLQISEKIWNKDDIPDWNQVKNVVFDSNYWMSSSKILTAYNLGITQGIDDIGTCNPYGTMTRAELCQMLYNMGIIRANSVRYPNPGRIGGV